MYHSGRLFYKDEADSEKAKAPRLRGFCFSYLEARAEVEPDYTAWQAADYLYKSID